MGIRIHQLPSVIANQIAAGEVIERPASVVKELLENCLDAGANNISVEIGYGGLNQIKVSDNGAGIFAEDLPLAVAAHATSKIKTLDDLYAIESMGFRGEALASIASIAKVTISSKPESQEHAMMLQVHNGTSRLSPCARNVGTTIDVVDLFFNAPVRKRFLKNEKLEFQAIEQVIKRFALSAPQISIALKHNNKLVLSLPIAPNEQARQARMARIFGSGFVKDAIYLEAESGAMRLNGWISGANYQRSQNDKQWVYINQRMVKDKLINHALKQAYDGFLYPGRFPACLLYLTINTAEVDVNVHPTKHEVRFQQPRLVHDFFTSQLTAALQTGASDRDHIDDYAPYYPTELSAAVYEPAIMRDTSFKISTNELPQWDKKIATFKPSNPITSHAMDEFPWIILNNQYFLIFIEHQPYIVDSIALQQEWLFHQLQHVNTPLASRLLLVPVSYPVPPQLKARMHDLQLGCEPLGIRMECTKDEELLIRSVPIAIPYLDLRLFLEKAAELTSFNFDNLLATISQTQRLDPQLMSKDERWELNQFLLNMHNKTTQKSPLCRALSVDDCRKLLHV